MKSGCENKRSTKKRSVELPIINKSGKDRNEIGVSTTSRWRAAALIGVNLLIVLHIIQWLVMGRTLSPIEPSESMYTLQQGVVNAGFIFFVLAILATLIFGRYVCGWGCHIIALQDLCAWILKKMGLTPRPFRSRILVYVPLAVALYMFVWPTVNRYLVKPAGEPLIPQFTNHLITTEFWSTFPPIAVAIPFLFVCGFMTVYFLGSKGFCTYACPYGGFFSLADKVAPGRIRVTDACNQCGHCTATCTSNVLVHAEVAKYGMVVDTGCMKCMDCVSVCPNDALYFGFGKPAAAVTKSVKKTASLSWPEEIAAALIFVTSFMAVWDVYQLVPMLMALGIAMVTTFVVIRSYRLLTSSDLSFYRYSLRSGGTIKTAGIVFLGFAALWTGLNIHSGWVRYHERAGALAFQSLQIPDELALARSNPDPWLSSSDRENIAEGKDHFTKAVNAGLFTNVDAMPKLAWFEYLSGNPEKAADHLAAAADRQSGQGRALSLYYRGAILNRLGRYEEAIASLDKALAERPDLAAAREEKGESMWQLGRRQEAVTEWGDAVQNNPRLVLANSFLSGAAASMGRQDLASDYRNRADQYVPPDARFHFMLGLRLQRAGMNDLAKENFQRAIKLDPSIQTRWVLSGGDR
ncbi:MAG: tetratricopeptide repeat protein [Pyrinomonadaceae bacterium]|nr:tetratricopeptide repeat protein [Pyrinomonadaceae bacterium]